MVEKSSSTLSVDEKFNMLNFLITKMETDNRDFHNFHYGVQMKERMYSKNKFVLQYTEYSTYTIKIIMLKLFKIFFICL